MNVPNQRNDQATATAITNSFDSTLSITEKHFTIYHYLPNDMTQSPLPTITPTVITIAQFLILMIIFIHLNQSQILKKIHKRYSQHILFKIQLTRQLQVLLIIMIILKY